MKEISFNQLSDYHNDGLVLLGCGGDLNEWDCGVREEIKEFASVTDLGEAVSLTTSGGRIDILIPFTPNNEIKVFGLAKWRLTFGDCSWLSDYVDNCASQHAGYIGEQPII